MPGVPSERRSDPLRSRSSIRTGAWASPEWKTTRPEPEAENAAKAADWISSTPSATGVASPVTFPAARSNGCAISTDSRTKRRWPDAYSACVAERTTSLRRRAVDRPEEDRALPGLSRAGQEEEAPPVRQEARVAVRVVRVRELREGHRLAPRGRDAVQSRARGRGEHDDVVAAPAAALAVRGRGRSSAARPPRRATFLSFPSEREKNAIQRPSGDQNGNCAPSDPGYSVTRPSAIART